MRGMWDDVKCDEKGQPAVCACEKKTNWLNIF